MHVLEQQLESEREVAKGALRGRREAAEQLAGLRRESAGNDEVEAALVAARQELSDAKKKVGADVA